MRYGLDIEEEDFEYRDSEDSEDTLGLAEEDLEDFEDFELDEAEFPNSEEGEKWAEEIEVFMPVPVETPGGGRVKDKTPPNPVLLVSVLGVGGKRIQLHKVAAAALEALLRSARASGIKYPLLLPVSGYRSPETQMRLWRNALKKYGSPEAARKWVAPPRGSAHQTGRAIDFYLGAKNSSANVSTLRTLATYKWLAANARQFGFYPYTREPWHWEYNPPAERELETYPETYEGVESFEDSEDYEDYEDEGADIRSEFDQETKGPEDWGEYEDGRDISLEYNRGELPQGILGTLTIAAPEHLRFSYKFTPEDVLWTARFIVGEAGGKGNLENRAVIWAMFNRYAFFTRKYYKTFYSFLRAYSTPLQPVLRSWGAAKRHMHKPEFVRTGGFYAPPHDNIPRGQLRQFLKLQASPWNQLPQSARSLALKAAKGLVDNPIGNASEFGSTYVYFHDKYLRKPVDEEWRRYTEVYARQKGWIWIGQVPNLNQKKNAFFIQKRVSTLPLNAVRVNSTSTRGEV